MSKYSEFDLDLKQDTSDAGGASPAAIPTAEAVCWWISLSVAVCGTVSDAIDCLSKNSDCSDTRSQCSPCGSSIVGVARC